MIVEKIIDILFYIFRLFLGYLPYDEQLIIADRVIDIYGYSIYMLGTNYYTWLISVVFNFLFMKFMWKLGIAFLNLIRGSGI